MLCLRRRRKVICSGGQKSVGSSWLNVRGLAVQSCFASVLSFNEDALFKCPYVSKTLLYLLQEVTNPETRHSNLAKYKYKSERKEGKPRLFPTNKNL